MMDNGKFNEYIRAGFVWLLDHMGVIDAEYFILPN